MSKVKRFVAFCLSISIIVTLLVQPAFADGLTQGYLEQLSVKKTYETVDEKIPVRKGAYQEADIVERWESGLYFDGDLVTSARSGLTWIRVEMEDGTYAFVYPEHVQEHSHHFVSIANYCAENDPQCLSELQVCKCGEVRSMRWNGEEYTSCDASDVLCQWASGEHNAATALVDLTADLAIDDGILLACNPATIASTEGIAGVACVVLIAVKGVRTTDSIICDVQEENYIDVAFDVAGGVVYLGDLLELAELNKAVKHSELYETVKKLKDTESYEKIKKINNVGTKKDWLQVSLELISDLTEDDGKTVRTTEAKLCPANYSSDNHIIGPVWVLEKSQTFSIDGFVGKKEYPLKKVETQIIDYYGNTVYSATDDVIFDKYSFRGSKCDNEMQFQKLDEGSYEFRVYVTEDELGMESTSLVYSSWFTIR